MPGTGKEEGGHGGQRDGSCEGLWEAEEQKAASVTERAK